MNIKKMRKLIRDPKLFISDMMLKRNKSIDKLKPKKNHGAYQYTVVSAVYNVSNYLDNYFESITTQRLDFENNIFLIMVDDGSVDNSSEIIKKWQKKFPKNIKYIFKDNGGQASARNVGLNHVTTEWVTFIDPDDFVDINYFLSIDKFISKNSHRNLDLVSCNFIFYFEDKDQIKDTHPLKYRFSGGDKIIPVNSLEKEIQLSVNSAIFKHEKIQTNNLKFNENIKPNFEDAHFASSYLLQIKKSNMAFLKSAKYLYRKRSDGSSTLDKSWEKPGLYDQVLELGCLDLLKKSACDKGNVPENIQVTVVYHLIWYFKKLINNQQKLHFLSLKQQERFLSLLDEIFVYIDESVIMRFNLAGAWFYHKVGMLGAFKDQEPNMQIVYVEGYDRIKKMVQLRYFTYKEAFEIIEIGGKEVYPSYEKIINHSLLSRSFAQEKRIWVKIGWHDKIRITISDVKTTISLAGKQYSNGITGEQIVRHFDSLIPDYVSKAKKTDSWILMDRDYQADDNAEHLYRYISKHHPNQEIYFALKQSSHDWDRLKKEGFNLLDFGGEEHLSKLKSCSKVISSHVDYCVVNLLGPRMLSGRHFIFLQHGVTKDDLSGWLNQKENIDCFITSSNDEYKSIISNDSKYKYSSKEVKITGFPRHDSLLTKPEHNKQILIMPTWRASIAGEANRKGHDRSKNPDFSKSDFAIHWNNLFNSQELKNLSEKYDYKIVLHPHPNLINYIDEFDIPSYFTLKKPSEIRIQELFNESSLLITDYSSVAFELAIQGKQTIYYQFDEKEVFSGAHTYSKGYYEYRKHGFGPVCNDLESVFISLEKVLKNDAQPSEEILNLIENTFPYRDGKSCERTYNAITALDQCNDDHIDIEALKRRAIIASKKGYWVSACERWEKLFSIDSFKIKATNSDIMNFAQALLEHGKAFQSLKLINSLDINTTHVDLASLDGIKDRLNLAMESLTFFNGKAKTKIKIKDTKNSAVFYNFICAFNGDNDFIFTPPKDAEDNEFENHLKLCDAFSRRAWDEIETILESTSENIIINIEIKKTTKIITLFYIQNKKGDVSSISYLNNNFSKQEKDSFWWIQSISTSHRLNDHKTVVDMLSPLNELFYLFPPELITIYLNSLRNINSHDLFVDCLSCLNDESKSDNSIRHEIAEFFFKAGQWAESAENWLLLSNSEFDSPYKLAYSYRMLGMIDESYHILKLNDTITKYDVNYWLLRSELAQITENWDDVVLCWNSIIRLHPTTAPKNAIIRLQNAQLIRSINSFTAKEI